MDGSTAKACKHQTPVFSVWSSSSSLASLYCPGAEDIEAHVSEGRADFSPIVRKVYHALLQWRSSQLLAGNASSDDLRYSVVTSNKPESCLLNGSSSNLSPLMVHLDMVMFHYKLRHMVILW